MIAIHNDKQVSTFAKDDGKSDKKDAALVRAGAATLVKMMGELREQLDATRRFHNQFNEAPKYNF